MPLFEIAKKVKEETPKTGSKIKLKKGQTINDLIEQARRIVEEKLKDYKETSKCVINIEDLQQFFNQTPDNSIVGIDTETTGLNQFSDTLVGVSLCNGKDSLYIPLNHKSVVYNIRIDNQMNPNTFKEYMGNIFKTRTFKFVFHNAKFDLGVLRTFFGYPVPDPYWDTMLAANLFNQNEDHNLKYLYNKYIAEEDEGVNRFDSLFKRNNL